MCLFFFCVTLLLCQNVVTEGTAAQEATLPSSITELHPALGKKKKYLPDLSHWDGPEGSLSNSGCVCVCVCLGLYLSVCVFAHVALHAS